jgi:hypothetical protein
MGDPIPGVDVLLGKNPGGQLVATRKTDSKGVATFAKVPPGVYRVQAGSSQARSAAKTFTLKAPSSVRVSVKGSVKAPALVMTIHPSSSEKDKTMQTRTLVNTSRSNIKQGGTMADKGGRNTRQMDLRVRGQTFR